MTFDLFSSNSMKGVNIVPKDAVRDVSPPMQGRGNVRRWGGYYIIIRADGKGGLYLSGFQLDTNRVTMLITLFNKVNKIVRQS